MLMRSVHILFHRSNICRALLWLIACFGVQATAGFDVAECGDTIYFKDGMRTACQTKAWEEKDEVHCQYEGGVLIYSKRDVDHIEKGPPIEADEVLKKNQKQDVQSPPQAAVAVSAPPAAKPSPASKPPSGVLFYDPRRAKKYWSSPTAHHDSYRDAITALAAEFDRPAQWVEENMGDTNDLEKIRDNLSAKKQLVPPVPAASGHEAETGGIEFYNPRRPQKYWTAQDARYNTFAEAVAAFAREFGKPAAWVETHMGDSNDVEAIRHALRDAERAEKTK
jgi:hypothetical protein